MKEASMLIFRRAGKEYGISTEAVRGIITKKANRKEFEDIIAGGMPLMDMSENFEEDHPQYVIILYLSGIQIALTVDQVVGTRIYNGKITNKKAVTFKIWPVSDMRDAFQFAR